MRTPLTALVLALHLAGCTGEDPYAGEPDEVSALEWTLEPGSFYLPTFETPGRAHVRAHVTVLEGDPIDAFLAHGRSCGEYPTQDIDPVASLTSTTNGTMEAELPGGNACLILDNHDLPPGTSPGLGTVRVAYRLEIWTRD